MKKSEGSRELSVTKILVYAAIAFLTACFQASIGHRVAFFGATPQIALAVTCAAAFFYGPLTGVYTAIVCGVFAEAIGGVGVVTLPLLYAITAWVIGSVCAERSHGSKLLHAVFSLLGGTLAGMLITAVRLAIGGGKPNIFSGLLYIALPEALNTLIYGAAVFAIHALVVFLSDKRHKN